MAPRVTRRALAACPVADAGRPQALPLLRAGELLVEQVAVRR
jgi:hypothetical protein